MFTRATLNLKSSLSAASRCMAVIRASFQIAVANQAQLVLSIFLIGFGIGQFVMGPLSDRFGRRPVLIGGMILYGVASVLAVAAPCPGMVLAPDAPVS